MTTMPAPTIPAAPPPSPGGTGPLLPRLLRSEWTKLRSVRSTPVALGLMAVLTIGFGALAANSKLHDLTAPGAVVPHDFDPTSVSLFGLLFGQIGMGVLGVLAVSSEFGTGLARTTFSAVPDRRAVLAAKAAVITAVSLVLGEAVSFLSWGLGQQILGGTDAQAHLGQPGVLRAVVCGGLYLAVVGLVGVGLATAMRHTAAALTSWFGLVYILPTLVRALPERLSTDVNHWTLVGIGDRLTTTTGVAPGDVGATAALAAGIGWLVVSLLVGWYLLARRDI